MLGSQVSVVAYPEDLAASDQWRVTQPLIDGLHFARNPHLDFDFMSVIPLPMGEDTEVRGFKPSTRNRFRHLSKQLQSPLQGACQVVAGGDRRGQNLGGTPGQEALQTFGHL